MKLRPLRDSAPALSSMMTKTNSTMTAPAYTMTCAAARNSAPSNRYSTASEPITPTSEMALDMGCDCTTTLMAHTTATIANTRKITTSMLREPGHEKASHQQDQHRGREKELPGEAHQLVVAEARQRAANPHESEKQRAGLSAKPE